MIFIIAMNFWVFTTRLTAWNMRCGRLFLDMTDYSFFPLCDWAWSLTVKNAPRINRWVIELSSAKLMIYLLWLFTLLNTSDSFKLIILFNFLARKEACGYVIFGLKTELFFYWGTYVCLRALPLTIVLVDTSRSWLSEMSSIMKDFLIGMMSENKPPLSTLIFFLLVIWYFVIKILIAIWDCYWASENHKYSETWSLLTSSTFLLFLLASKCELFAFGL